MLIKLTEAIKKEFNNPYPDRRTALKYFRERYFCEQTCEHGAWFVDLETPITKSQKIIADQIFNKYCN